MPKRTISIPEHTDQLVRDFAYEGESFSSALTRLIELGATAVEMNKVPSYVGSADGPDDLGLRTEEYLREYFDNEWTD
jgi:hypothetical protein